MNDQHSKDNIRTARSLALNIALLGGPNLTHLDDKELLDRMMRVCAGLSLAVKSSGLSFKDAQHGFQLLQTAAQKIQNVAGVWHSEGEKI